MLVIFKRICDGFVSRTVILRGMGIGKVSDGFAPQLMTQLQRRYCCLTTGYTHS